jgi:hypothetical protein
VWIIGLWASLLLLSFTKLRDENRFWDPCILKQISNLKQSASFKLRRLNWRITSPFHVLSRQQMLLCKFEANILFLITTSTLTGRAGQRKAILSSKSKFYVNIILWHVWKAELPKARNTHCQATDRIMYPRIQLKCSQLFYRQGSMDNRNNGVIVTTKQRSVEMHISWQQTRQQWITEII